MMRNPGEKGGAEPDALESDAPRAGKDGLPILHFLDSAALSDWLAGEGAAAHGAWLMFARKNGGGSSLSRQEAIDAALCEGWIDGQTGRFDDRFFLVRFTPRRPRSKWSQINRASAERLIDEGRMRDRGQREVEAARQDGRWEAAYPSPRRAELPPDLRAALGESPEAAARFALMKGSARYALLLGLANARRPETRARRIRRFVSEAQAEAASATPRVS